MKKIIMLLGIVFCFILCADDAAEIKKVLLKEYQFFSQEDLKGCLQLYTTDYISCDDTGEVSNYQDEKDIAIILDGKHPVEFFIYLYELENDGKKPSKEEINQAKESIQSSDFRKEYQIFCLAAYTLMRRDGDVALKTIKFHNVYVSGDFASVVYERKTIDIEDETFKKTMSVWHSVTLKKIDGTWKITSDIIRKK